MSRVFLVLGFVMILMLYSDAQPIVPNSEDCCFSFFLGSIPPRHILSVKKTSPYCPQQGFIITTPKIPSLCVRKVMIEGAEEYSHKSTDANSQCVLIRKS
ncbi:hypothetical protein KOW79_017627 [Hemibagrus wyckioides]|uniref:Chemokine interleukin-8-like domain-containing protein n=1 Tax=Hemibagrus wyckioides TaxID=337641 RepID=A0A9D3ND79_9TELE|nr:hypothetical protein KOW79_017627 [Hemibagrus wyckioides]